MAVKKDLNNQKLGVIVLVVLLFLVGFGAVSLYQNQKTGSGGGLNKETKAKIMPKTASLAIRSDVKTVSQGESFTVKLVLDSGNQGVEAADFSFIFDPRYLQAITVTPGKYFKTYPIKKTEENYVKISGVAYFDGKSIIVPKGRGEVASIIFSAVAPVKSTMLTIDREKTIVASDGQNILAANKITDLSINVK